MKILVDMQRWRQPIWCCVLILALWFPALAAHESPATSAAGTVASTFPERVSGSAVLRAPDNATLAVPLLTVEGPHYGNLRYEANNISMRGALDPQRLPLDDGQAIAARWLELASQVAGLFVLRDSLFSQQDHPVKHRAKALMLPPNWVTAAVSAARRGVPFTAVRVRSLDDDEAWAAIETPEALFGDFPPSDFLHREACRALTGATPGERRRTRYARQAVASLGEQSNELVEALPRGAQAVAEVGADLIVASDVRYFGAELRRSRIIPIFVQNPSPRELQDGKGMEVPGDPHVSADDIALATRAIYSRRLQTGDLAVERYDISKPAERRKAIALLTQILPRTQMPTEGGHLWLWVNGPLKPDYKVKGENAADYIEAFRQEVAAAPIDTTRLRFLSKPQVVLPPGKSRQAAFDAALKRFASLDMWFSVDLTSVTLARLLSHTAADDTHL